MLALLLVYGFTVNRKCVYKHGSSMDVKMIIINNTKQHYYNCNFVVLA